MVTGNTQKDSSQGPEPQEDDGWGNKWYLCPVIQGLHEDRHLDSKG